MFFKPKIMIADQDPRVLNGLGEQVARMGGDPLCVGSGPLAIDVINHDKFHGAIVDWNLASTGASSLVKSIRQSNSSSQCVVVILHGKTSQTAARHCFREGVHFYLPKPVNAEQLYCVLTTSRDLMLEEQFRYQRTQLSTPVFCRYPQHDIKGWSLNLSSTGMLVALEDTAPPQREAHLQFTLPGETESFDIDAQVARITPKGEVAFHFRASDQKVKENLVKFTTRASDRSERLRHLN
ncbi:MAG: response regulator [Acidobacteriota bacterium]